MLSFARADLPERDQVDTSFDTLYHLGKKLEACHQPHSTMKGGLWDMSPTKVTRSIPPPEDMQPPWNARIANFLHLAQAPFKLPRGGPGEQDARPKEQSIEVVAKVISYPVTSPVLETGPTMRWVGPKTVVDAVLEGCSLLVLANSGGQVNMMTSELWKCKATCPPIGSIGGLPPSPGRTGWSMYRPLGFIIVRLQVKEVAGYNEDVVFIVVPDESAFSSRVPLVIGSHWSIRREQTMLPLKLMLRPSTNPTGKRTDRSAIIINLWLKMWSTPVILARW